MTTANWKTNEVKKSNLDSGVGVYLCVNAQAQRVIRSGKDRTRRSTLPRRGDYKTLKKNYIFLIRSQQTQYLIHGAEKNLKTTLLLGSERDSAEQIFKLL